MDWWRVSFESGSILTVLGCYWFIVDENYRKPKRQDATPNWIYLAGELIWLSLAFGFFFMLESWAQYRAPLFYYPDSALGLQWNAIDWSGVIARLGIEPQPHGYLCYEMVRHLKPHPTIPISVPAMEAAVTYSALRTARFLVGVDRMEASTWSAWWIALIGALTCLIIDLILDPAVSTRSVDCGLTQSYGGAGVWEWIEDEAGWFGVPVWNYAVWFAGPIVGCAIAYGVRWLLAKTFGTFAMDTGADTHIPNSIGELPKERKRSAGPVLFLFLVGLAAFFVIFCAHDAFFGLLSPEVAGALRRALVLGTAAAVLASIILWSDTWHRSESLRWPLVLAQLFFITWSLAWYIGNASLLEAPSAPQVFPGKTSSEGPLAHMAYGVGAAILLSIAGAFVALAPYVGGASRVFKAFNELSGFIRIHYLSHTSMNVYLGAGLPFALAGVGEIDPVQGVTAETLWILLWATIFFHVFMVLLNDWKDWELDKTDPRRSPGKKIREAVGRNGVLLIALIASAGGAVLNYAADGSWGLLALAYGGMAVYNLYGKEGCIFGFFGEKRRLAPYWTDLIQGVAWGALVLYAASLTSSATDKLPIVAYVLAASGTVYILLVNGCHGSLRDLANDIAHDKWTTARHLGATVGGHGRTCVPGRLRNVGYGYYVVHILLMAVLYAYVNANLVALITQGWIFIVLGLLIWSSWLMKKVLSPESSDRNPYLSQHALALMLAPMAVLLPAFEPPMQVVTVVWFVLPFVISRLNKIFP